MSKQKFLLAKDIEIASGNLKENRVRKFHLRRISSCQDPPVQDIRLPIAMFRTSSLASGIGLLKSIGKMYRVAEVHLRQIRGSEIHLRMMSGCRDPFAKDVRFP